MFNGPPQRLGPKTRKLSEKVSENAWFFPKGLKHTGTTLSPRGHYTVTVDLVSSAKWKRMKQRFWLFKRGSTFYFQDSDTGEQKSLSTKNKSEALRLIEVKRESAANPAFGQALLQACLTGGDREFATRTWKAVMDKMLARGKEQTQERLKRAFDTNDLKTLESKKLVDTTAADLTAILDRCKPSTNHFLRRLHNLALGLNWIFRPIVPPKIWKKPAFKEKRGITLPEHQRILAVESNRERKLYYRLLWEIGAAQSDAASLSAGDIKWGEKRIEFKRKKTGVRCSIVIGPSLASILRKLPKHGPLFPQLNAQSANDRAAEFYRRCKLLGITGVSLHSYRYAWAERAKSAGYPERFAQEALGHSSRAVHNAYAKNGHINVPALEDFELRERRRAA